MEQDGMSLAMGFRNSIDKSMPLGICAGVTVFVCDNLALSGDFIKFRKHTSGLTDESLQAISMDAVGQVIEKMEIYRTSINDLKNMPVIEGPVRNRFALRDYPEIMDDPMDFGLLHTTTFKALMFDMSVTYNIFPITKIDNFISAFKDEAVHATSNEHYQVNSWYVVFNAVTRMAKRETTFNVAKMTAATERMIRKEARVQIGGIA